MVGVMTEWSPYRRNSRFGAGSSRRLVFLATLFLCVGVLLGWVVALDHSRSGGQRLGFASSPTTGVPSGLAMSDSLYVKAAIRSTTVPILMYHYIDQAPVGDRLPGLYTPASTFHEQIKALRKDGYQFGTLSELRDRLAGRDTSTKKMVILTFDDGYEDFYTNAWPILRQEQVPATIYLVNHFLGRNGYLTEKQVKELAASPLITIGAHTLDHIDLARSPLERQRLEIVDSKSGLEKLTGKTIIDFCYPAGQYTSQTVALVKEAGFLTATTTHTGVKEESDRLLVMHRVRVENLTAAHLTLLLDRLRSAD